MKKLVLMATAIVAVSFASCGNKAANNTTEAANAEATEDVAEPATEAETSEAATEPAAEEETVAPAAQADNENNTEKTAE